MAEKYNPSKATSSNDVPSDPKIRTPANVGRDVSSIDDYNDLRYWLDGLGRIDTNAAYSRILNNNLFFDKSVDWYNKLNRYGWIDPFDDDRITKEYLFFTKPDLNIMNADNGSTNIMSASLNDGVKDNSVIAEVYSRNREVLGQLQYSINDKFGRNNPFMYLLSNSVTSKLDLPGISAESQDTTSNVMGTSIMYRGHSLKSDNGYDFSLSFKDTAYLEVYLLAKSYDEYIRLLKQGLAAPRRIHIIDKVLADQFSIYKFLVGSDGETIIYYAKLTGCYFTDVPRSDMADPGDEIKFSLSFHAQFVEDMNPEILTEFSYLCNSALQHRKSTSGGTVNTLPVYDSKIGAVNNQWAASPYIIRKTTEDPIYGKRVMRRGVKYDYFLKWVL